MLTGTQTVLEQADEMISGLFKKSMEEDKTGLTTIVLEMSPRKRALTEEFQQRYDKPAIWNSAYAIQFLQRAIKELTRRKMEAEAKFAEFSEMHSIDSETIQAIRQRTFQSSSFTKTPKEKLNWLYGAICEIRESIRQYKISLIERQISLEEILGPEESKHTPETVEITDGDATEYRQDFSTIYNPDKAAQVPLSNIVLMLYRHNGKGVCGSAGYEFSAFACGEVMRRIRQPLSEVDAQAVNSIVHFFETNTGLGWQHQVLTAEMNASLQRKIDDFKKIYSALREGQSGFFKTNLNFLRGKEGLSAAETVREIERYSQSHPDSRTNKAWSLAKAHPRRCSPDNTALFTEIYKWSFEKSGFFKQSQVTGQSFFWSTTFNQEVTQLTAEQIRVGAEKENSRTANIHRALGQ